MEKGKPSNFNYKSAHIPDDLFIVYMANNSLIKFTGQSLIALNLTISGISQ
ncbi:MAG: hypothetical protein Tp185DCM00d2C31949991_35 [Prokaryotic dsDNA virus sp.]|nr:MAG: hypothetical protein Tp162SUR1511541_11 [Prokaryotic dsDNA virus sp.]QDP56747.1 MAG: hypothetical protein Tp185DCM00d2C31949991_35 [Prokaryotic dsDNA virus sp.]QDP63804.1 MAG: hypothetical protein Unbinned2480contig1002_58 [Prokaryotic dsDNA virus sp.]QDP63851.1 MAG: hypothetical protein GOVbin2429_35 [Prokaryotic dsDNA virus sp.]